MIPPHRVAIVVDTALAPELEDLARGRHTWAVRTPETEEVALRVWNEPARTGAEALAAGLTLFTAHETPEGSLLSILETVELHHGEYSRDPPVSFIEVLGIEITETIRDALTALDFREVRPSAYGFTARRETA